MGTLRNKGQMLNWGKIENFKRFRDQYVKSEKLLNYFANFETQRDPSTNLEKLQKSTFKFNLIWYNEISYESPSDRMIT